MLPHMVSIVPHLTTNCRVRQLRISVPMIERLIDGVGYFRPDNLPPPAGEELRPLFRPRLTPAPDHRPPR